METKAIVMITVLIVCLAVVVITTILLYKYYANRKQPVSNDSPSPGNDSSPPGEHFDSVTSITGGNHKENTPLDFFSFKNRAKPTADPDETPMNKVNDTVNDYSNVTVNVSNHDISLINDLDDEFAPEDDDLGAGIELDYGDDEVLVIEEADVLPDSSTIDIDVEMTGGSDMFGSFGTMLFSMVTPPEPTQKPRDMSNRVEVISEKTVNDRYITGGDGENQGDDNVDGENQDDDGVTADDDYVTPMPPAEDDEEIKPMTGIRKRKLTKSHQNEDVSGISSALTGGSIPLSGDDRYDPDTEERSGKPDVDQFDTSGANQPNSTVELDDSIIDNGQPSDSDTNEEAEVPLPADQPEDKPDTEPSATVPANGPEVQPEATPVDTTVDTTVGTDVIAPADTPVTPVVDTDVAADSPPSDLNAFKAMTGGVAVDPNDEEFNDDEAADASDAGEEDSPEEDGAEEDDEEDGAEEEDQK